MQLRYFHAAALVLIGAGSLVSCRTTTHTEGDNASSIQDKVYNSSRAKRIECVSKVIDSCDIDGDALVDATSKCGQLDYNPQLELFLESKNGRVIAIRTDTGWQGYSREDCEFTEFKLDSKIVEMLIIGKVAYMRGENGQLYFMTDTSAMYELLSGSGNSYVVKDMDGSNGALTITLSTGGKPFTIDREKLIEKIKRNNVAEVRFHRGRLSSTAYKVLGRRNSERRPSEPSPENTGD